MKLDAFTRSYLETALGCSNDESRPDGGDPLGDHYTVEDFSDVALAMTIADCGRFLRENATALSAVALSGVPNSEGHSTDAMAGHDFWLTRNGHGTGFWDGDYPEPQATILTDAAHAFGGVHLYVGDDGKLYFCEA